MATKKITNYDDIFVLDNKSYNQIDALGGNDIITIAAGCPNGVVVNAGTGDDTVNINAGTDHKVNLADGGNNIVNINVGKNIIITGGNGNDTITIANSTGITGFNELVKDSAGMTTAKPVKATASLGKGNDIVNIKGGRKHLIYTDAGMTTTVEKGAGNDIVNATGGQYNLVYTAGGADTMTISSSIEKGILGNIFATGTENDLINISGIGVFGNKVQAGAGQDTIVIDGIGTSNQIWGDNDDDVINILGGSTNKIYGDSRPTSKVSDGAGSDTVTITGGDKNYIHTADGSDTITLSGDASVNNNKAHGGEGNDLLKLSGGTRNFFYGNEGNDTLIVDGGTGNYVYGGAGQDSITLKNSDSNVIFGDNGYGDTGNDDNDRITVNGGSKNKFYGNGGNDIITFVGDDKSNGNKVLGGGGNDTISITGGVNTTVWGGDDDDTITVKNANNTIVQGGAGSDTYNITWTLGDSLIIDNRDDKLSIDVLNIQGTNITKDSFIYQFDDATGTMVMTDSQGGILKILFAVSGDDYAFNFNGFTIGKDKLSIADIENRIVDIDAYIIDISKVKSLVVDGDELEAGTVAIKGLAMDMQKLSISKTNGKLIITNGTKTLTIKNISSSIMTNLELCDGAGDTYIIRDNKKSSYECEEDGDGADRYIFVGNNWHLDLSFGEDFSSLQGTVLDMGPLGKGLPCYTKDGKDLIITFESYEGPVGTITLKGYYNASQRYNNVIVMDVEQKMTIPELLAMDFLPVGFTSGSNTIVVNSATVNKSSLTIGGAGTDLSAFSASIVDDALILTNGTKIIKATNISQATFSELEIYGGETYGHIIKTNDICNITNISSSTCANRYFYVGTGWTTNFEFSTGYSFDESIVLELGEIAQVQECEFVATKNENDLSFTVIAGEQELGVINIRNYYSSSQQVLYSTIKVNAGNSKSYSLPQIAELVLPFEVTLPTVGNTVAVSRSDISTRTSLLINAGSLKVQGMDYTLVDSALYITAKDMGTIILQDIANSYLKNILTKVNDVEDYYELYLNQEELEMSEYDKGKGLIMLSSANANASGTKYDDYIKLSTNNKTIAGNDGNDIIIENGSSNTVDGGNGDDTIIVNGTNTTVIDTLGNNIITVYSAGASVTTGTGNDTVYVQSGSIEMLNTGAGTNTINISGGEVASLDLSAGNNIVTMTGGQLTAAKLNGTSCINIKDGIAKEIQLTNACKDFVVSGGIVEKLIGNSSVQVLIVSGGQVAASLAGGADTVTVSGGAGHNIDTGANNDTLIITGGSNSTFDCGSGADIITISGGNKNTIDCGTGNNVIVFENSDSNTITCGYNYDVFTINNGNYNTFDSGSASDTFTVNGGSNNTINTGAHSDTVTIYAGASNTYNLDNGDDYITLNGGTYAEIDCGFGNDTVIITGGSFNKIDTSHNNDTITISGGNNNNIDGGNGNNVFTVENGDSNTIIGGSNYDIFTINGGNYNTFDGGSASDTFTVDGGNYNSFAGGQGNDIYDVQMIISSNTVITIDQTTAATYDQDILKLSLVNKADISYSLEDDDLLLTHTNGGKVIVKNWANRSLDDIIFANGESLSRAEMQSAFELQKLDSDGLTAVEVLKVFMASLDVTTKTSFEAVNEAIEICSLGKYISNSTSTALEQLIADFKSDCINHSGTKGSEAQISFLKDYCGIDLTNTDTGAITGYDAGGNVVKDKDSVVQEPEGMTVADFTYSEAKTVTATYRKVNEDGSYTYSTTETKEMYASEPVNGVTFYWDKSTWASLNVDESVIKSVIGGVINAWAKGAFDLIEESYGINMTEEDSILYTLEDGTKGIQIFLQNANNNELASVWSWRSGGVSYQILNINLKYYGTELNNISGNSSSNQIYLDRLMAHEMVHGVMAANIDSFAYLPSFIKEGLSELVHGVDDSRKNAINNLSNTGYYGQLSKSATVNGSSTTSYDYYNQQGLLDAVFDLDNYTTRIGSAKGNSETYGAGYMLFRYLAKQISDYSKTLTTNSSGIACSTSLQNANEALLSFASNESMISSIAQALDKENNNNKLITSGNIS